MTRVAVVAASAILRTGLTTLVRDAGFDFSGSAASVAELPEAPADVILIAGSPDGLPEPEDRNSPALVVITDEPRRTVWDPNLAAVLPSDARPEEIEAAIHAAAAGLVVMRRADYVPALQSSIAREPDIGVLTARELEVLQLVAEGLPNKTIAWRLGISEHTVKFHVASILGRLQAGSRAEAVAIGIRRGLILL